VRAIDPEVSSAASASASPVDADAAAPSSATPDTTTDNDTNDNLTVYTLRLTTASARNAGASDPNSAVQVLLVGRDGRALLRRVEPHYDPSDAERQARHICDALAGRGSLSGGGEGVGADCSMFLGGGGQGEEGARVGEAAAAGTAAAASSSPPRPPPPGPVRARFQPGAVDEVSFLAPDLGHPLAALIVAPEQGTWRLDEATVHSSRAGKGDRFVCRSLLGSGAPGAARAAGRRADGGRGGSSSSSSFSSTGPAYLTPVAAGAVVVGEGSAARAVTRAEAEALYSQGMGSYDRLRGTVAKATAVLAAAGTVAAGAVGGVDAAVPVALGGVAGLGYWGLLQVGVEAALPPVGEGRRRLTLREEGGGEGGGVVAADELEEEEEVEVVLVDEQPQQQPSLSSSPSRQATGSPLIRFLGSAPFRVAAVGAVAVVAASATRWGLPGDGATATAAFSPSSSSSSPPSALVVKSSSPHGALKPWQLALAAAGFLSYKVAVVGVGALGWGGEEGGEGGGDNGGGGGRGGEGGGEGGGGGGGRGPVLSAREMEAMLAMRAPSPSAGGGGRNGGGRKGDGGGGDGGGEDEPGEE
jgi:hypothetical protein